MSVSTSLTPSNLSPLAKTMKRRPPPIKIFSFPLPPSSSPNLPPSSRHSNRSRRRLSRTAYPGLPQKPAQYSVPPESEVTPMEEHFTCTSPPATHLGEQYQQSFPFPKLPPPLSGKEYFLTPDSPMSLPVPPEPENSLDNRTSRPRSASTVQSQNLPSGYQQRSPQRHKSSVFKSPSSTSIAFPQELPSKRFRFPNLFNRRDSSNSNRSSLSTSISSSRFPDGFLLSPFSSRPPSAKLTSSSEKARRSQNRSSGTSVSTSSTVPPLTPDRLSAPLFYSLSNGPSSTPALASSSCDPSTPNDFHFPLPGRSERRLSERSLGAKSLVPPLPSFNVSRIPNKKELELAFEVKVTSEKGSHVSFGSLIGERKTIVCFIRHFWCPLCQDYMFSITRYADPEIMRKANVNLIVISNGSHNMIKSYRQIFQTPFALYTDPTHKLYTALGMTLRSLDGGPEAERGAYVKHGKVAGIGMVVKNAVKAGMPVWEKGGDIAQLGGEFIFGPGSTCSYSHRMRSTRDHAPILKVLAAAGIDMFPHLERLSVTELSFLELSPAPDPPWVLKGRKSLAKLKPKKMFDVCGPEKCELEVPEPKSNRLSMLSSVSQGMDELVEIIDGIGLDGSHAYDTQADCQSLGGRDDNPPPNPRKAFVYSPESRFAQSKLTILEGDDKDAAESIYDAFSKRYTLNSQLPQIILPRESSEEEF